MYVVHMTLPMNMFWIGNGDLKDKLSQGYRYVGDSRVSMEHVYLYGTQINFRNKNSILIKNDMVPTGTTLYRWDYMFSYGTGRNCPQLPTLIPHNRYQIYVNMVNHNSSEYWLRVLSFNYGGRLISIDNLCEKNFVFECNEDVFNYSVEIVVNGPVDMDFRSLDIVNLSNFYDDFQVIDTKQMMKMRSEYEERLTHSLSIMDRLMF
ncbi:accessory Sec system protein Asp3 [Lactiplantibacillus plantarum]|uniref:accessory Sec system protein Asp3 n=1 Tax=Lactiplantibacillus plantarum TaxID=1590 RepID=UPI003D725E52